MSAIHSGNTNTKPDLRGVATADIYNLLDTIDDWAADNREQCPLCIIMAAAAVREYFPKTDAYTFPLIDAEITREETAMRIEPDTTLYCTYCDEPQEEAPRDDFGFEDMEIICDACGETFLATEHIEYTTRKKE